MGSGGKEGFSGLREETSVEWGEGEMGDEGK